LEDVIPGEIRRLPGRKGLEMTAKYLTAKDMTGVKGMTIIMNMMTQNKAFRNLVKPYGEVLRLPKHW
jgi:hypothetical protein